MLLFLSLPDTKDNTVIGNTKKNLNLILVMKLTESNASTTNKKIKPKHAKN